MLNIKKSILFTAYYVNGSLTCVRCNLTGKFVKRSIYFAINKQTTSGYGVKIDFNMVSLLVFVTSMIKADYKEHKQAYNDGKIAIMLMFLALPIIFVVGQCYRLVMPMFA